MGSAHILHVKFQIDIVLIRPITGNLRLAMLFKFLVSVSSHDLSFEVKVLKRACIDEEMFLTEVRVHLLIVIHSLLSTYTNATFGYLRY